MKKVIVLFIIMVSIFFMGGCFLEGEQGPQGISGETPYIGTNGNWWIGDKDTNVCASGIQGIQGEKGDKGEQGIQGEKGDKGEQGIQGIQGEKGDKGEQGIQGEKGLDANHAGERHKVTFNVNGGTMPNGINDTIEVEYGDYFTLPIPTYENHTFLGWYTGTTINDGKFTSVTPVIRDTTLYAIWQETVKYFISYETNGGQSVMMSSHYANEKIEKLPIPSKADNTFIGWYFDSEFKNRVSFPLQLTDHVTIYAKWTKATYEVSYKLPDDSSYKAPDTFLAGYNINSVSAPNVDGMKFEGWYLDDGFKQKLTLPYEIHSSITLYAKYVQCKYTISIITNGGTFVNQLSTKSYVYGEMIDTLGDISKSNNIFKGWYTDSNYSKIVTFPYTIKGDVTFYAKWTYRDPYTDYIKIYNMTEFQQIKDMNKNYLLMNDINFEGVSINIIGSEGNPFKGIFDGGGHTLKNYSITNTSAPTRVGLFDTINGSVINLSIEDGKAKTYSENGMTGILACVNNGQINNCKIQGETYSCSYNRDTTAKSGGIVCYNYGTISNCEINVSVNAHNDYGYQSVTTAGGVCEYNRGLIENNIVYSSVTSSAKKYYTPVVRAAGIAACNDGTIKNNLFIGGIEANETAAIKYNGNGTEENNYKSASVSNSGGIATNNSSLNSSSFYTNSLKLDLSLWNLSNLDFANGKLPKLKTFYY